MEILNYVSFLLFHFVFHRFLWSVCLRIPIFIHLRSDGWSTVALRIDDGCMCECVCGCVVCECS